VSIKVGALEAKLSIETNRTYVLSEQNILDCASVMGLSIVTSGAVVECPHRHYTT